MQESKRHGPLAYVATVLLGILLVALFIVVMGRPGPRPGVRAREAECKAKLHDIQLYIERYATDHGGEYPAYLIGGEPKYAAQVDAAQSASGNTFAQISDCDVTQVSDPLLRAGYIDAYPRNPFVRDSTAVHRVQEDLPTSLTGNDPLRNGAPEAKLLGTRFGPYGTTMGQVLCDPRYPQWQYANPTTGATEPRDSWAIVEYRMWDMWQSGRRGKEPYLAIAPGQFFYKSMGKLDANMPSQQSPAVPAAIGAYMLGVYGGIKTKGKDALGAEAPDHYVARDPVTGRSSNITLWLWSRSQMGTGQLEGSPFGSSDGYDTNAQWIYGNANGIYDGVILVIMPGFIQ